MLRQDLLRFIEEPSDFNQMALRVFAYQYERSTAFRKFCDRRNANPKRLDHWKQIPMVPVEAFKHAKLYCGTEEPVRCFLTSGTSGGPTTRGKHYFQDMDLFTAAVRRTFKEVVIPELDRIRMVMLAQPPEQVPGSLITCHLQTAIDLYGAPGSGFFVDKNGLRLDEIQKAFSEATQAGEPVLVMGTAFAHLHLCDSDLKISLPPGSLAVHCGGFKGRSREVTRPELHELMRRRLGVNRVINLYGMTEATSHFYGDEWHELPPWAAVRILDPDTLAEKPDGETGLVGWVDLINLDACVTVLTQDLGVRKGDRSVLLLGRVPGAESRGCSMAMDDFLLGAQAS
jgi:phenylacetate-coenzyme A ligase PaaK-like adenylate-forming protein